MSSTVEKDLATLASQVGQLAVALLVHVERPNGADAMPDHIRRVRDIAFHIRDRYAKPAQEKKPEPEPEKKPEPTTPAADDHITFTITSVTAKRPLNGTHFVTCPTCNGIGYAAYLTLPSLSRGPATVLCTCRTCHGDGVV